MNREIKFRAWNKIDKIMGDLLALRDDTGMILMQKPHSTVYRLDPKDCEVMQYTGLKDKNGKEIYEGDITRDKNGSIGVVQYNSERAYFEEVYLSGNRNFLPEESIMEALDLQVIGNIYENPELLK